jgi:membrane protease YdiL (CAAX protease family)
LRRIAIAEITAMAVLLLSYIWIWQGAFPGDFWVVLALYLGIGFSSHLRRGESFRDIGLRLDNFGRAARSAVRIIGPLILIPPVVGLLMGTLRPVPLQEVPFGLAYGIAWGTLQQYGLACFFFRRAVEVFPGKWPPMVAAASLFALFHLPNPFLTAVTLVAGTLGCWIYRRTPNLWVLGIAHGLLSASISRSLPLDLTLGMRVGPRALELLVP